MRSYIPGGDSWTDEEVAEHQAMKDALLSMPTLSMRVLEIIRNEVDMEDPDYTEIVWRYGELIHLGFDIADPRLISQARFLIEYERRLNRPAKRPPPAIDIDYTPSGSVVYYIQLRDTIKIGTSVDPVKRCRALAADRILAVEPGSHQVESLRHRQFAAYRVHIPGTRERFHPSDQLMDHILAIREKYADIQVG